MVEGRIPVGCGFCLACKVNDRRVWTSRQLLESMLHKHTTFLTLTYADEHMPERASLDPAHTRDFIKRLRWHAKGRDLRYYLVGEYGKSGSRKWNPHYHASIFGLSCIEQSLVDKSWKYGYSLLKEFTVETAAYTAEYIMKKMTKAQDLRLDGRYPEYSRKSLKPALGLGAVDYLVNSLCTDAGMEEILKTGDIPYEIRVAGKNWPLGRYIRSKIREEIGFTEELIQAGKTKWMEEQLQRVQELRSTSKENPKSSPFTPSYLIGQASKGRIWQLEKKHKTASLRRKL